MPTTATDTELVRQYLAGDQRALGDIYERYGDRVYDLCFAMLRSGDDAADAYQ
ncbi:MAG: RNA polymerase sigma factor, partial [Actinobacteria bacterium]|nr:RNA polymerase sigma factor [Actinomycetota bacterium]